MMLACALQLVAAFELVSRLNVPGPWLPEFRDAEELKPFLTSRAPRACS